MIDVFELVIFVVVALVVFTLAYLSIHFFLVSKKMAISFLESNARVDFLLKRLDEVMRGKEEEGVEKSTAFIGFISESREKAFEYIEDVQSSMYQLKVARQVLDIPLSKIRKGDLEILRNVVDNVLAHLPEDSVDKV